MKKIFLIALLSVCQFVFSQSKGTVKGKVTDKEMGNEALPFANVFIKGTSIGGTTDMDGNYSINAPVGSQTIVFSFVGYETVEKPITVKSGGTTTVNVALGANQGVSLQEVEVKASVSKEKESALLLEQKKATVIKESIGAQELAKKGVSDAAAATTKISGVTKSEGSGNIYIRGLGDRYLSTSMNGLPIPSDDVNNKNINLNLFSTNIIQNVGISKTYGTSGYADQGSGNVNIVSKEYTKNQIKIGVSGGINTSVMNLDNFRQTIITDDVQYGFHTKKYALVNTITYQGWDTKTTDVPFNYGFSLAGGAKFNLLGKEIRIFGTASYSSANEYQEGLFKSYRSNVLNKGFSYVSEDSSNPNNKTKNINDTEKYITKSNLTGYGKLALKLNDKNKIAYNVLFVNKGTDNLYEQGRKGFGYVFDQLPQENGAFVRDQNFKQTSLFVNQLMGKHQLNQSNTLHWAGGYNFVLAEEPNRIRNEVNILNPESSSTIQFAHNSFFQQRKSNQKIEDTEYNGFIENKWALGNVADEYEKKPYSLNYGINIRKKERNFRASLVGVSAKNITAPSIDEISSVINASGFNNGLTLVDNQTPDRYQAELLIYAGYVNFDFNFDNNFSGNLGLRYEKDEIDVIWDVTNFLNRIGSLEKQYESLYPSVNLKYEINEKNFIRFASGVTQTLPEFKELSPFEYVFPTGRVVKGDPDLEKSDVYSVDLKWEFFPNRSELISATVFYKQINNPINLAMTRGSSGNLIFKNTGDKADVLGLELESRLDILKNEDEQGILSTTGNVTLMYLNQDLHEEYQYKDKTESKLQGASNFIFNGSVTYNDRKENPFIATLTGNYSSDKIYALGVPESQAERATLYNDEIIEKGFFTLDLVLSKKITKFLTAKLTGKNLLDPEIQQTQRIRSLSTGIEKNEIVQQYTKGVQLSVGLTASF